MKNYKHTPQNNRLASHTGEPIPRESADDNKQPSVLDKLKEQIKKIKDLKEQRPDNSGDTD